MSTIKCEKHATPDAKCLLCNYIEEMMYHDLTKRRLSSVVKAADEMLKWFEARGDEMPGMAAAELYREERDKLCGFTKIRISNVKFWRRSITLMDAWHEHQKNNVDNDK